MPAARVICRSEWIEFVVHAEPNEMLSHAGIEVDRDRCRVREQSCSGRDRAEVEIEILDLAGPVAAETDLRAGACGPAELRLLVEEGGGGGVGAGDGDGNLDGIAIGIYIGNDIVGQSEASGGN